MIVIKKEYMHQTLEKGAFKIKISEIKEKDYETYRKLYPFIFEEQEIETPKTTRKKRTYRKRSLDSTNKDQEE